MKFRGILFIYLFVFLNSIQGFSQGSLQEKQFFIHIQNGNWSDLKKYFNNITEAESFLSSFTKNKNNTSDYSSYYPFKIKSISSNSAILTNQYSKEDLSVLVNFLVIEGKAKVASFSIDGHSANANYRVTSQYNYVVLPTQVTEEPKYLNSYIEEFNNDMNVSVSSYSQDIVFRQIDFTPLKLSFRWCEKFLGMNFCTDRPFTKAFGPVLSDEDHPDNANGVYQRQIFKNIADITTFKGGLDVNGFNPSQSGTSPYLLTAAIVDNEEGTLTIFREGVNPLTIGDDDGEMTFEEPVAVKEINGLLYVLDKGEDIYKPKIYVLKVYNTMIQNSLVGNFGVELVRTIHSDNLSGLRLDNPIDIGGYTSLGSLGHQLLILDKIGLQTVSLDISSNIPTGVIKSFDYINDQKNYNNSYRLFNAKKVDARSPKNAADLGNVIFLLENNTLVSITCAELEQSTTNQQLISSFVTKADYFCNINNLAYMLAEEKWYLTDYTGKLHKLDKEGRYIGGGGNFGQAQGNNELFLPNSITPNPIGDDPANDFRYRFMVANKWGYSTGVKLFSPGLFISKLKAFENLNDGNLAFAFTMSGNWIYIEGAKSIQVQTISINKTPLLSSQWNTQIDGTIHRTSDPEFLTNFPETITLIPGTILKYDGNLLTLKRGWNSFTLDIQIKKILEGVEYTEIVTKTIDFYWLPSKFTPTIFNSIADIRLNNSTSPANGLNSRDYIYKPIVIGAKGVFYDSYGHPVNVSEYGNLQLEANATFFNRSQLPSGLGNIHFKDNGELTLMSGAYICVSGTGTDNGYHHIDLTNNLSFDPNYKKGINPNPQVYSLFQTWEQAACKSACEFLVDKAPVVTFTAVVDMSNNNPFKVTVNPAGTTYFNKLKWEVEEVGNSIKKATLILNATDVQVFNLNEKLLYNNLPYQFLSCKDYKITLSTGCNDGNGNTEWISSASKNVGIYYPVNAGPDLVAC